MNTVAAVLSIILALLLLQDHLQSLLYYLLFKYATMRLKCGLSDERKQANKRSPDHRAHIVRVLILKWYPILKGLKSLNILEHGEAKDT